MNHTPGYIYSKPHPHVGEGIHKVVKKVIEESGLEFISYSGKYHMTLAYWNNGIPVRAVESFKKTTEWMRVRALFEVVRYELWGTLIVAILEPYVKISEPDDHISESFVNEIKNLRVATGAQHSERVQLHITIGKVTREEDGRTLVNSINDALAQGLCDGKKVTKIFDILG